MVMINKSGNGMSVYSTVQQGTSSAAGKLLDYQMTEDRIHGRHRQVWCRRELEVETVQAFIYN